MYKDKQNKNKIINIDEINDEIISVTDDIFMDSISSNDDYDINSDDTNMNIDLEIIDYVNGKEHKYDYKIPMKSESTSIYHNKKRLLCMSVVLGETCIYSEKCTYAHNLSEQIIDSEKLFSYKIILDKNSMNFYSLTNPKTEEIYRNLLILTNICDMCLNKKCTGGYNCKYGVHDQKLKLCKNDLLTGECVNKIINIDVGYNFSHKFTDITLPKKFVGCINGHHLSSRQILPFYKYLYQRDNSFKNKYQSVRYIDLNSVSNILKSTPNNNYIYNNSSDSESSTDEELNEIFKRE